MTLTAACQHWPANQTFAVFTALTAELCKLALGWNGITSLRRAATWRESAGGLICLLLAAVFYAGSISASVICMSQAESTEHAHQLRDSRAYASAVERLRNLDSQMAALHTAADNDIANGFRKRGLGTLERLDAIGVKRQEAEAHVAALEQHPTASTSDKSVLPQALALVNATSTPDVVNFLIEIVIGAAIELAGFLFTWRSIATTPSHPPELPNLPSATPPPPSHKHRRTRAQTSATPPYPTHSKAVTLRQNPAPAASAAQAGHAQAPAPSPTVTDYRTPVVALSQPVTPPTGEPIPASYARSLRFDAGKRLEARLRSLEAERCAGACRDLLHRMGNHCLRVGGTNGIIDASVVRSELRAGRDWRTIEGYLGALTEVGALTRDGSTYSIAHFLDANPSVQRRAARLAELRSKACKRQRKHRGTLQTSQAKPLQKADLKPLCGPRHAQKPTTHDTAVASDVDVKTAQAATHKPTTTGAQPHSCNSGEGQREGATPATRRKYGAVKESTDTEAGEEAWLATLAKAEARGTPTALSTEQAGAAADEFEASIGLKTARPSTQAGGIASPALASGERYCIRARIEPDTLPINLHDVAEACRRIGVSDFGCQAEAIFRTLARGDVRRAELAHAAWCTRLAIQNGTLRKSAVGMLYSVVRRQRLQAAMEKEQAARTFQTELAAA